jgi:hypothetical protein
MFLVTLAYWAEKHDYTLPEGFIQHVQDQGGAPPDQAAIPLEELGDS